jgi:hypothetical protein
VTATFNANDGASTFGPFVFTFQLGSTAVTSIQNFDGVTAPALPAGWTPTFTGSGTAPTTVTTFPDTPPNALFFSEAATVGLSEVTSPSITIPGAGFKLNFRTQYNTEATYDGLVLEISVNGGAFQDIIAAGGTFASGGYNSTLNTGFSNPLPGRQAWSGLSGGTAAAPAYVSTVVNLPAAAAGQPVQFKWRQGSDSSVVPTTNAGSRIDTITLTSLTCGGNTPAIVGTPVSRKTHGSSTYDVPLPLGTFVSGIGIEPRTGAVAGEHQIVTTFANPVTLSGVSVTTGTGNASASVAGNVVTINLTGVTDVQRLGVTLAGVSDGANLGSVMIPMGLLLGDTSGNASVSGTDISQTKANAASGVVDGNTFRTDVNSNGLINASDIGQVKARSGTVLP